MADYNTYRNNYANLQPGSLGSSGFRFNTVHDYTPDQLQTQDEPSLGAGIGQGVMSGASLGTGVMPGWGTLIGAVAGGLYGGITAGAAKKRISRENQIAERRRSAMEHEQQQILNNQATLALRQSFNPGGNEMQGFYALGGSPMDDVRFIAEDGEVVQEGPGNSTQALQGGRVDRLASDVAQIEGRSHAEGGVKMSGGERVFSDKLKLSEKDWKKFMMR